MNKRTIAALLAVLAIAAMVYWAAEGANIYTKTERQVEVKDELFGTTKLEWEKDFQPGLEYTGPIVAVMLIAAGWLYWSGRRNRTA